MLCSKILLFLYLIKEAKRKDGDPFFGLRLKDFEERESNINYLDNINHKNRTLELGNLESDLQNFKLTPTCRNKNNKL